MLCIVDGLGVDICACGHPVRKHVLADTEYARCHGSTTLCRCEGGVRVVGNALGSVARYFSREMRFEGEGGGKYMTLNRAVEKSLMSSAYGDYMSSDFVWTLFECDGCGLDMGGGQRTAYGHLSGEGILEVEVVCGICALERG